MKVEDLLGVGDAELGEQVSLGLGEAGDLLERAGGAGDGPGVEALELAAGLGPGRAGEDLQKPRIATNPGAGARSTCAAWPSVILPVTKGRSRCAGAGTLDRPPSRTQSSFQYAERNILERRCQ